MDKIPYGFVLISSTTTIIALGFVSFALCIASEFKNTRRKDLKVDGKLCYLPESPAFGFGIGALICVSIGQIIGSFFVCINFSSGEKQKIIPFISKRPTVVGTFLCLSWVSFGVVAILLSAATSMNKRQPYGEGWLDSECYVVRDGVFGGSAVLVLVTIGGNLVSAAITFLARR